MKVLILLYPFNGQPFKLRIQEMNKLICREFTPGRRFMGRLPHGKDIIGLIENFCKENSVQTATFSLIGAVSAATLGAYDQKQLVYVTFKETAALEILSCIGNISLKEGSPFVHAHIVLGDEQGKVIGGHLFSETLIFAGEIEIRELTGPRLERAYDPITGLALWTPADPSDFRL